MTTEDWTVLAACICWCLWCLVLTEMLEQDPRADHLATFIGLLVIVIGVAQ